VSSLWFVVCGVRYEDSRRRDQNIIGLVVSACGEQGRILLDFLAILCVYYVNSTSGSLDFKGLGWGGYPFVLLSEYFDFGGLHNKQEIYRKTNCTYGLLVLLKS
jgi:hypothetical protein